MSPQVTGAVLLLIQILPIVVSVGCCIYAFAQEHGAKGVNVAKRGARALSQRLGAKSSRQRVKAVGVKVVVETSC